jgi:folate-dependent phosphoribosylglycinamide formyltransferase PurN
MRSFRLVALVSGGGRTVLNLLDRIAAGSLRAEIPLVLADRECLAIGRLRERGVRVEMIPWPGNADAWGATAWPRIEGAQADLVVSCGFLRLLAIPPAWLGRVMNIHPGLLPRYGGKGFYGDRVHAAVLAAGEKESGCTVHFSDNEYDKGPVILERRVPVLPGDTTATLAARVFEAECEAYPEAIRRYAEGRLRLHNGKVVNPMTQGEQPTAAPNRFAEAIRGLTGVKARFYVGGGERGYFQGPVVKVDGNLIYIEKQGPIRGTIQTITINADYVVYYEIDKLVNE